jgi:hypothetical protein
LAISSLFTHPVSGFAAAAGAIFVAFLWSVSRHFMVQLIFNFVLPFSEKEKCVLKMGKAQRRRRNSIKIAAFHSRNCPPFCHFRSIYVFSSPFIFHIPSFLSSLFWTSSPF